LYGMTRKSYEAVTRTRNSFGKAMAGVNRLLEKKVPFVVKGAFLPANADEIRAFDAWAETLPWMDKPPSLSIFHVLHARRERSKNRAIRSVRPDPETGVKVLTRDPGAYLKDLRMFLKEFAGKRDARLFTCGAGMHSCSVDAYGRLQPCLLVRHPETVYNLEGGSLKDALDNFFPAIRKRKAENQSYLERCARCPLRGFCEQCPGNSWMEDGTLDGPVDYFCEVAHVQAKALGLLKGEERAWEIADWGKRLAGFSEADARKRLEDSEWMNAPSLDEAQRHKGGPDGS
jgi:radical SAM protein with 4Fe4S-binding SPASM domain